MQSLGEIPVDGADGCVERSDESGQEGLKLFDK